MFGVYSCPCAIARARTCECAACVRARCEVCLNHAPHLPLAFSDGFEHNTDILLGLSASSEEIRVFPHVAKETERKHLDFGARLDARLQHCE